MQIIGKFDVLYLRFWYQVLTWVSLRFNLEASSMRSWTLRYFWRSKLCSRVFNWWSVNAVRAFRVFLTLPPPPWPPPSPWDDPDTSNAPPWSRSSIYVQQSTGTARYIQHNILYSPLYRAAKNTNKLFIKKNRDVVIKTKLRCFL